MDKELTAVQLDEEVQEVSLHRDEARRTRIPQGIENSRGLSWSSLRKAGVTDPVSKGG